MAIPQDAGREARTGAWFAWLTLLFAAWILGGAVFWVWAVDRGLTNDVAASLYHIPFYLGIATLAGFLALRAIREVRAGRSWRGALPPDYGAVGVGLLLLLAWPIVDVGWREGIGLRFGSVEQVLAPSRLMLVLGMGLLSAAPLRASLRVARGGAAGWAAVVSAGLVLALAGGAGGFGPAASERLESPPNGPEDDGEIWVMAGDGSAQTRLIVASDGYDLGSAAWSPDGSQFAFTRAKSPSVMGVTSEDVDIWLASADGSNQRPLVEDAGWQWIPHWTPDGEWLLYTVDGPRGPGGGAGLSAPFFGWLQGPAAGQPPSVAPEVDVWRVRVDGRGQPERVTDSPADDRAGVASPDGRWILFDSTREEGRPGIYVMRADGTDVRRATFFGDDWGGTWSPDGTRIAFNSEQGNRPEDIYIVEFPGLAPPMRLTDDPETDRAPCFSPDGTRIAFYSSRDDEDEIWSMAADGTDLRNLTRTPGAAEYLVPGGGCWGPDGQILYQRSADAAASASALVREDLAVVGTLLQAVLLAIVTLAIIRLGAPFGAVALILGLATAIWVVENGAWQFVIAAMVAGLLADVVIRLAPTHRKAAFGGASAAAALVISASAAALATTGLAWSPSLTLGATIAAAAVGWGLSGLIAPALRPDVEVGSD